MWDEIQEKAKIELLHALFMAKIVTADDNSAPSLDEVTPESFFREEAPSDALLKRWRCIFHVCENNGLI